MSSAIIRPARSEKLTGGEKRLLKAWFNKQRTGEDAAVAMDINRGSLNRIMITGSGSPDNIKKVRAVINTATN
jgi:hypothetical protein